MTTLILSFFRGLSLENLEKTLYSLSKQTVKSDRMMLFDNNTKYSDKEIAAQVCQYGYGCKVAMYFMKHGDLTKTLSWSGNHSINLCDTETFCHVRADFIYRFDFIEKMMAVYEPNSFICCPFYQMNYWEGVERTQFDVVDLEQFGWRIDPSRLLNNTEGSRTENNCHRDSPSFVSDKTAFNAAGGFDETLTQWGYNLQSYQTHLAMAGVKIKVVPEILAYHMDHGAERDKEKAMAEWQASPRRTPEEAEWMKANIVAT